jgi:uncharacterized protein
MPEGQRQLAVITGASSGIGLELARVFAENGFDLVVVAEDPGIEQVAIGLRDRGGQVTGVQADLATTEGVEGLADAIERLGVPDVLAVNAGVGVNGPFIETDLADHIRLLNLNVTGAVQLTGLLVPRMAARGSGGVLFTSSIAATMPGPYLSTYSASKAFLLSFAQALRVELADSGVTVTALMPGPTDTNFFARAGMEDTKLGQASKDDPHEVARQGFEALMAGKDHVVAGSIKNRLQTAGAKLLPDTATAKMHGSMSAPGSGD